MNKKPIKAMILAAGYGTRMRPLSDDVPKAVMPLWNRSLLARNVELLRGWGVRDILVNAHHGADQVIHEAMSLSDDSCRITISHEPDILGTGGALRRAEWFFDEAPFWLINADVVADVDPAPLCRRMNGRKIMAALWMHETRGPRTVEVTRGYVTNFVAKQAGRPNTFTFCGLHLLSPRILAYLPETGFASIIDAYIRAMKDGYRVAAETVPGAYWADVGTPERYIQTHHETAHRFAADTRAADVCSATSARVGRGVSLKRCVIWDRADIAAGTRIDNAVIGRDVRITGRVSGLAVRAPLALSHMEQTAFRQLGFRVEGATALILPTRGSARSFIRMTDASRRAILIRYDPERTENTFYAAQARFLARHGWPVPAVLWHDDQLHRTIMEDAGDTSLTDRVQEEPRKTLSLYRDLIPRVAELHGPISRAFRRSRTPAMPGFDARLYRYERELFITHFLHNTLGMARSDTHAINRDLLAVARRLLTIRPVVINRDLQSSNIYYRNRRPTFIDFQGMRPGPAAYDLASLLCDPYVSLPTALRDELLDQYMTLADPRTISREDFAWASVQRLIQALGAFGRLSALPGCERFAQHIPTALNLLAASLHPLPDLPALKAFAEGASAKTGYGPFPLIP